MKGTLRRSLELESNEEMGDGTVMKSKMGKVLTTRLGFVLGAFLLLLLFSMGALLATRGSINRIDKAQEMRAQALDGKRAHYEWAEGLCSSIGFGTEFTGTLDYTSCALGKWLYSTEKTDNEQVAALIKEIIPVHQRIHESAGDLEFGDEQSRDVYLNIIRPDIKQLVGLLDEVIGVSQEQVDSAKLFTQQLIIAAVVILIILAAIAFSGTAKVVRYIKFSITEPIRTIEKNARRLQQGELDFSIDVNTDNEIGELADSLNDSIRELSKYVNEMGRVLDAYAAGDFTVECEADFRGEFIRLKEFLNHMQESLNTAFHKIDRNTEVVLSASTQVSGGAQDLAEGVVEQANTITEISDKIKYILESVGEIAENSKTANEVAEAVRGKMAQSTEKTHVLDSAMNEIRARSNEISKIIKTIEDIASQTNMLSLNAAIEAARAGEAGKGFAVVADQIRDLAAKSAQASQDTTELILESIRSVDNGSEIAQEMAASINETNLDTEQVIEAVHSISEGTELQVAAIKELQEGVERINETVCTSSATSEESAAASEELASLANNLDELVRQFQLK